MIAVQPKPGFDWSHVEWAAPEAPPPTQCAYCAHRLEADEVPLMMWSEDGHAAHFCESCQRKWWGFE